MSAGIGLGLDGPGVTPEGDYTLSVFADGDAAVANGTEVTVDWGDGTQSSGPGAGDYEHSLAEHFANYEGDVPLTDYTITTTAVARAQAAVSGNSDVTDAAVDSLGRRVTVGGSFPSSAWEVRRYQADGLVDTTFGAGGVATPLVGGNVLAVAVEASNRVVVAGRSGLDQFTVARLTAGGALDVTFGVGGVVTTTFGTQSSARALAIQPDGKIVAGGNSGAAGFGDFVLARYNVNGTLDTTFSGDGKASQAVAGTASPLHDLALSPTGRVVTVGTKSDTGDDAGVVVAFTAGGTNDGVYNINAIAGHERATAVTVLGDGKILVGEKASLGGHDALLLVKLDATGTADPSFGGGDGIVVHEYQPLGDFGNVAPAFFNPLLKSLVVLDDLSIVAGGQLINPTTRSGIGFPSGDPQGDQTGLAVFKFDADGNKDLAFDPDGVVYTAAGTWIGGAISGGQVALLNETIVQSGTVQDSPSLGDDSDAMGVYVETATYAVSVTNVAPTAGFADPELAGFPELNPTSLAPGQFGEFGFLGFDPSLVDGSDLTYSIDWGDGTTEQILSAIGTHQAPTPAPHSFEASGVLTIKLTVIDPDGGASSVATFSITIATSSGVVDDYAHPGETVLYVAAPINRPVNKIQIRSSTTQTQVVVDGVSTFAGPVDRVVVYGNVGDDTIQVDGTAAAAVEIYGGNGNDKLKSGNRNDVVVGGAGDDIVTGGVGRDFLVGGLGADKVVGEAEDDILIGGIYVGASIREAIAAVMAEWTSGNLFATRVQNLREGTGLNGGNVLSVAEDDATVFDDNAPDKLTGDGGQDWFFANAEGPIKDKITDLLGDEFTDEDRAFVLAP